MVRIDNLRRLLQSTVQALRQYELPNKYGAEIKAHSGRMIGKAVRDLSGSECGVLTGELMAQGKQIGRAHV